MPVFDVTDLPELVRDTQLDATVGTSTTIHTSVEIPHPRHEEWRRERFLSSGGSGHVWLEKCISGLQPDSPDLRAVKKIALSSDSGILDCIRELEALAKFSQPKFSYFFAKSLGWYRTDHELFISMEYFPLGDLQSYLVKSDRFVENDIVSITRQVVWALQYMHNEGFVHRDLKPANILLKSHPPDTWWIKLIDFGNSKRLNRTQAATAIIGTPGYLAPDILARALKYDESSSTKLKDIIPQDVWFAGDIWSLGEIIFRLFSKRSSFQSQENLMQYFRGEAAFPVELLESVGSSSGAMDFVLSAMKANPTDRITIQMASTHNWLKMTDVSSPSRITSNTGSTISSTRLEGAGYLEWNTTTDISHQSLPLAPTVTIANHDTLSGKPQTDLSQELATGGDSKVFHESVFVMPDSSPELSDYAGDISHDESVIRPSSSAATTSEVSAAPYDISKSIGHTTYMWDAKPIARFIQHETTVYLSVFSINAKYLITVSTDQICVWKMWVESLVASIPAPSSRVKAIAFYASDFPAIISFAIILQNGDVMIAKIGGIEHRPILQVVSKGLRTAVSISLHMEHKMIALGCSDSSVKVIDIDKGTTKSLRTIMRSNRGAIKWIFFLHTNGPHIISICSEGALCVWKYHGFWRQVKKQEIGRVDQLAFEDFRGALATTHGNEFKTWVTRDAGSSIRYELVTTTKLLSQDRIKSINFDLNEQEITTRTEDGAFQFWEAGNNIPVLKMSGPGKSDDCVVLSPRWSRFAIPMPDGRVDIFRLDVATLYEIRVDMCSMDIVGISPNGKMAATISPRQGFQVEERLSVRSVILWDLDGSKLPMLWRPKGESVLASAFSPDSKKFATFATLKRDFAVSSSKSMVTIWDTATGRMINFFMISPYSNYLTSCAAFSPDFKVVAAAERKDDNWGIRISQVNTGVSSFWGPYEREPSTELSDRKRAPSLRFLTQSRQLIACIGSTIMVFDIESGRILAQIPIHHYPRHREGEARYLFHCLDGLVISPNVKYAAHPTEKNGFKVINLETRDRVTEFCGSPTVRANVVISPDWRLVAIVKRSNHVELRDLSMNRVVRDMENLAVRVQTVKFSDDSRTLFVLGDTTILVYDTTSESIPITPLPLDMPISSIMISSKLKRAISLSENNVLQIWSYETGALIKTFGGY